MDTKGFGGQYQVIILLSVLALCWHDPAWGLGEVEPVLSEQVREHLRSRLESGADLQRVLAYGTELHATEALLQFYGSRDYQPAWSDEVGPVPLVDSLLKLIGEAEQEGLRPEDYHQNILTVLLHEMHQQQNLSQRLNPVSLAELDLLLTDAFFLYGMNLLLGRVNPGTVPVQWDTARRQGELVPALQRALESSQVTEVLSSFLPLAPGYVRLKQALRRYRSMAQQGGWPQLPAGPNMQLGDRDRRVIALRKRLELSEDLGKTTQHDVEVFDEQVERAVRRFQARHGLSVDGVLGPATLAALNVSIQHRLQQIRANLERWRWLPRDLGRRYIVVNTARFTLDVVEDEQNVMTMRIIVGMPYRDTPVFSSHITYLVLNPSWNVPVRIAVEDKLPLIRQDPGYLARNHMKVFQGWGTEAREIDPTTINWSKVSAEKFPYRLRQIPGPLNALGQVKFILPNPFDVYLHDTPSRNLFNRTIRTFSSGCIRVEKPIELAQYVLRGDPRWHHESLLATIGRRREQAIRLPVPMPVHILYWTAWVEMDGTVHFRDDIYHRDILVAQALNTRPPLPQRPPLKEMGTIERGGGE